MSQVTSGVLAAGLTLAASGLVFGLWPVGGEDCGSAFAQKDVGSRSSAASCAIAMDGRVNTAWLLLFGGTAVAVGAAVAGKETTAPAPKQAEAPKSV